MSPNSFQKNLFSFFMDAVQISLIFLEFFLCNKISIPTIPTISFKFVSYSIGTNFNSKQFQRTKNSEESKQICQFET